MKARISFFSFLCALCIMPAFAGWQHNGYYINDGYFVDDGSRFVMSFRGGVALSRANLKNDIGSLYTEYVMDTATGDVVSYTLWQNNGEPDGYAFIGQGDIGVLPVKGDFKKSTLTAGGSIGFVLADNSQWRFEAGYDYIAETSYNSTPLFEGEMTTSGSEYGDVVVHVSSTSAESTISTDVISLMAYYDFFEGKGKKLHQFIPYIGFGLGYASSETKLKISDMYGDLSSDEDLQNFGTLNQTTQIIKFDNPVDRSKYPQSNSIAVLGALGLSYGIAQSTFIDASVRVLYIPKITWNIANSTGTRHREWFSAENMIHTNFVVGLRFEF